MNVNPGHALRHRSTEEFSPLELVFMEIESIQASVGRISKINHPARMQKKCRMGPANQEARQSKSFNRVLLFNEYQQRHQADPATHRDELQYRMGQLHLMFEFRDEIGSGHVKKTAGCNR